MVGGVAGGMASYMNLDPAWVRIAWLALLVLGPGLIFYIIAWIAVPEADTPAGVQPVRPQHDNDTGKYIVGGLLILAGGSLLANQFVPWMKDLFIPAALIAVGTGVIIYSVKK
jgi:phage shock protein PspC (stress-responsive transcriptional regulator)